MCICRCSLRPENICFEALARAYKLKKKICRYIWGLAPPPPPYQKLATLLPIPIQKWLLFFLLACLLVSLFRWKMRTLFRWGFSLAGGGGGGLSAQILVPPYENPKWHGNINASLTSGVARIFFNGRGGGTGGPWVFVGGTNILNWPPPPPPPPPLKKILTLKKVSYFPAKETDKKKKCIAVVK